MGVNYSGNIYWFTESTFTLAMKINHGISLVLFKKGPPPPPMQPSDFGQMGSSPPPQQNLAGEQRTAWWQDRLLRIDQLKSTYNNKICRVDTLLIFQPLRLMVFTKNYRIRILSSWAIYLFTVPELVLRTGLFPGECLPMIMNPILGALVEYILAVMPWYE